MAACMRRSRWMPLVGEERRGKWILQGNDVPLRYRLDHLRNTHTTGLTRFLLARTIPAKLVFEEANLPVEPVLTLCRSGCCSCALRFSRFCKRKGRMGSSTYISDQARAHIALRTGRESCKVIPAKTAGSGDRLRPSVPLGICPALPRQLCRSTNTERLALPRPLASGLPTMAACARTARWCFR